MECPLEPIQTHKCDISSSRHDLSDLTKRLQFIFSLALHFVLIKSTAIFIEQHLKTCYALIQSIVALAVSPPRLFIPASQRQLVQKTMQLVLEVIILHPSQSHILQIKLIKNPSFRHVFSIDFEDIFHLLLVVAPTLLIIFAIMQELRHLLVEMAHHLVFIQHVLVKNHIEVVVQILFCSPSARIF